MKKTVLVTGATRGLGLAIARRLVQDGLFVIGTGRSETDGVQTLRSGRVDNFTFAPFDLSEIGGLHNFISGINAAHGPLFGLVNNAALGLDGVLGTMHNSDIERVLRVNVLAPMILTKYASRIMMRQQTGRIVNISSIIASTGFSGLTAYAGSKAALEGFTRSLARELGPLNVTVNAVAPGFMETEMTSSLKGQQMESIMRRTPLRRLATPDDAAGAVSYLLGPDGGSITGCVITVDAGSTS